MNKHELRLYFKDVLTKNHDKLNSDLVKGQIIKKISNLITELKARTVGLYYPLKYEVNLLEIVKLHPKIKLFLPKLVENEMKYCSYSCGDKLTLGELNIYEPINNDFHIPELLIIPGLAFSNDGYRLGYGKGHFDKYIKANADIITIGVCLKEQLIDNFPVEEHDQKLKFVISV